MSTSKSRKKKAPRRVLALPDLEHTNAIRFGGRGFRHVLSATRHKAADGAFRIEGPYLMRQPEGFGLWDSGFEANSPTAARCGR